jgi:alpha-1,2-mannosyltransferase
VGHTMKIQSAERDRLWKRLDSWKWVPIAIGAGWFLLEWVKILVRVRGDFPLHWELGRRIVSGIYIYTNHLNFVYPPFWAMAHAPLVIFGSPKAAQVAVYPFIVLWLVILFCSLIRLTRQQMPLSGKALFWVVTTALALAGQFVTRDLPEAGVNTMLVALSWLAVDLWSRRRDMQAGICLGLAAALKCTPLLFIAYFALKREWRITLYALAALAVFSLSPIILMGPKGYHEAASSWVRGVIHGVSDPDPSRGVLGEERVINISLRPALARYLMHLPYGHLGRPETSDVPGRAHQPPSRYYVDSLNLKPAAAGVVVKGIMIVMVLAIAWGFRRRPFSRDDPTVVWECAVLSLLILLISPITWKQHCVGVLPGLYLVCGRMAIDPKIPRWIWPVMGLYTILAVFMNREFLGKDLMALLDSYKVKTAAILILLGLMLAWRAWALSETCKGGCVNKSFH